MIYAYVYLTLYFYKHELAVSRDYDIAVLWLLLLYYLVYVCDEVTILMGVSYIISPLAQCTTFYLCRLY